MPQNPKHVEKALSALENMENVGSSKRVRIPFPEERNIPYKRTDSMLRGAVHGKVPVDKLFATQPTVKRSKVERFIKEDGHFSPIPTVIKIHGRFYIANGHHRATADRLLGKDQMRANIVDLGNGE